MRTRIDMEIEPGYRIEFNPDPDKLWIWIKNDFGRYLKWRDGSTFQRIDKIVGKIIADSGKFENHRFNQFNLLVDIISQITGLRCCCLPRKSKSFVFEFRAG